MHLHLKLKVKLTLVQRLQELAIALGELQNGFTLVLRLLTDVFLGFFEALTNDLICKLGQNFNF